MSNWQSYQKVRNLVVDGLRDVLNNNNDDMGLDKERVDILYVRSWTMGGTVSRKCGIGT